MRMLGHRVAVADLRSARPQPKQAESIYSTPEYRAWRALVITRAGGRCQWPGCGRKERRMFADHIVELSDDGAPFDPANGQCLCGSHHTLKTTKAKARRHAAGR